MVIDLQEPFLRSIWEHERLLENVSLLLRSAKVLRIPIVPTVQNEDKLGGIVPEIAKLIPSEYVPYDKMCFSGQADDAVGSEIRRSGRKQLLICGIETHICVEQTALDLVHEGFEVHVAADAVSSRTQANWEIGLSKMERNGVMVTSAEMAIYEMLTEAGTPEFREILEFVKDV